MSVVSTSPNPANAGAAPSFDVVFESELNYVMHSLRRLGVRAADLEDVAQEIFVAIAKQLHVYDPSRPLRPWVFAFVFRFVSNYMKHRARKLDATNMDSLAFDGDGPERALLRDEARDKIHKALAQLPLDDRAVLMLFELDGCSAAEIAQTLEMQPADVYARLRTARERFKRAYRGVDPASGEVAL